MVRVAKEEGGILIHVGNYVLVADLASTRWGSKNSPFFDPPVPMAPLVKVA